MNNQSRIPNPETIKRHIAMLQEVCRQYDALNSLLDEAIASAEADIRNSPLNVYRLRKAKQAVDKENVTEAGS